MFPKLAILLFPAAVSLFAQPAATENPATMSQGMPARTTAADYQASGQAGAITIAGEFLGHNIPTLKGTLTSEDYVAVEVAFFGAAEGRIELAPGDFQLRVSDKKTPLPRQPYGFVFRSLKDPELEPTAAEKKSKGSGISTGGGGEKSSEPPTPVKVPIEVVRDQQQRIQKSALPGGDRPVPVAGLIYFSYRGKTQNLTKIDLIYNGKAGSVIIPLL